MLPILDEEFRREAEDFVALYDRYSAGSWSERELAEYQAHELGRTVSYVRERSPFYSRHLSDLPVGVPRSPAEIGQLPFTTKDDLRTHLDAVPSLPLGECWIYYETTGTTGVATPCPRAPRDSMRADVALLQGYRQILGRYAERCVVAVLGPTELHSTGDTFSDVLRGIGHATVKMWPHSPLVGFERAIELIDRLSVDVLVCTPGMAISLARALARQNRTARETCVRAILALGELATPNLLGNIGTIWGADVYNCMYASQEASILGVCFPDGLIHSTPLNIYYEIVDPDSGDAVTPRGGGAREGELVVTHLYQGAKPLVRYRTGDMVRATGTAQRFSLTPLGRVRDRVAVGGRLLTAFDFEQAMLGEAPTVLDYQAVLANAPGGGDRLSVLFEPAGPLDAAERAAHSDRVARHLERELGVDARVAWGPTGSRTSTGAMVSWKAARLRDDRSAADSSASPVEAENARQIAARRERAAR